MLIKRPFYFLRHGETDWNVDGRAQGQSDIPLNERGIEQARAAAKIVQRLGIKNICTSPLSRAHETARLSAEVSGIQMTVIDDLKECSFGEAEGRQRGGWISDFWQNGVTPEGGEHYPDFQMRALRGINSALEKDGPVLIVAHAGVYRIVLHYAALLPKGITPNAVPIWHKPPIDNVLGWTTEILE
ncbi:MAG: histidine phosphatase family protein [Parvibaculaceae bacterium]